MEFHERWEQGGIKVIAIAGNLDTTSVAELRARFLEATDVDVPVVLDCAGLYYLDSNGLAFLVNLLKKMNARESRLVLCGLPDSIVRVLQFTKLDTVFTLSPTREEAVGMLRS